MKKSVLGEAVLGLILGILVLVFGSWIVAITLRSLAIGLVFGSNFGWVGIVLLAMGSLVTIASLSVLWERKTSAVNLD